MRYWDLCAPCHVDYDFIGTAENYSKEAELFVRQANISVTFPEHEQKTTRESSLGIVLYFKSPPNMRHVIGCIRVAFYIMEYNLNHIIWSIPSKS